MDLTCNPFQRDALHGHSHSFLSLTFWNVPQSPTRPLGVPPAMGRVALRAELPAQKGDVPSGAATSTKPLRALPLRLEPGIRRVHVQLDRNVTAIPSPESVWTEYNSSALIAQVLLPAVICTTCDTGNTRAPTAPCGKPSFNDTHPHPPPPPALPSSCCRACWELPFSDEREQEGASGAGGRQDQDAG